MNKHILVNKKDLVIEWFSGSGAGGQHRNKCQNCCRIKHPESGAIGIGTSSRSQKDNQSEAFTNMTKSFEFKKWLNIKLEELRLGQTIEQKVEKSLSIQNLKIEMIENGQWVEYKD